MDTTRRTFLRLFAGTAIATEMPLAWFAPHGRRGPGDIMPMGTDPAHAWSYWMVPFLFTPQRQYVTLRVPGPCLMALSLVARGAHPGRFALCNVHQMPLVSLLCGINSALSWHSDPSNPIVLPRCFVHLHKNSWAWLAGKLIVALGPHSLPPECVSQA